MTRISKLAAVLFAVAMVLGCGEVKQPSVDASPQQHDGAPADATVTPMVDAMAATAPSGSASTSGGGSASSTNYRLQVRFGAPSPMGNATSANFSARLGPPSR